MTDTDVQPPQPQAEPRSTDSDAEQTAEEREAAERVRVQPHERPASN